MARAAIGNACAGDYIDPRYLLGFFAKGVVAKDSSELNSQHGPRLWSQCESYLPDDAKPERNRITDHGALLLAVREMFAASKEALDALEDYFETKKSPELRIFKEYRSQSSDPGQSAPPVILAFRSGGPKWVPVPGTDRRRMVVNLSNALLKSGHYGGNSTNASRFVKDLTTTELFVQGMVAVTEAMRRRFKREEAARALPYLDMVTLEGDLFVFNLLLRVMGVPSIIGADTVCSTLIDLGDMETVRSIMTRASSALGNPDSQRQLEELGVTVEAQLAAVCLLQRELREANGALEERLRRAEEAVEETKKSVVETKDTVAETTRSLAEVQEAVTEAKGTVEEMRQLWIPPDDRLYAGRFLSASRADTGPLSFIDACKLFGSLVTAAISEAGLVETIGRELMPEEIGSRVVRKRNVYSRRQHLSFFERVLAKQWTMALEEKRRELEEKRRVQEASESAIHRSVEFERLYEKARLPPLADEEREERRKAWMLARFRQHVPKAAEAMGLSLDPQGSSSRDGRTHKFAWSKVHLPAFEKAFAYCVGEWKRKERRDVDRSSAKAQKDVAQAERAAAKARKDAAKAERNAARAERDAAKAERDAAQARKDAAKAHEATAKAETPAGGDRSSKRQRL